MLIFMQTGGNMKVFKLDDILKEPLRSEIIREIVNGSIFIYPTDTVYGLGCNALIEDSVIRIRDIKKTDHPFSVIAPSMEWIKKNFVIRFPEYLEKLPGPYTFILKQKKEILPKIVSGSSKIGIRIPDHPFTRLITNAGVPFITTSANISGEKTIRRILEIPTELSSVDIVIDGGTLGERPSEIWDLTGENPVRIR